MSKIKTFIILSLIVTFLMVSGIKEAKGYYYDYYYDYFSYYYPYYYDYHYYYDSYYDSYYSYPYYYYDSYYSYPYYYDYYYSFYPSIYFSFGFYDYEYKWSYSQPQIQPDPQVDLKVEGLDGPITVSYSKKTITLSWTSQHADSCTAFGDWSGSKPTSGSEEILLSTPRTYHFTLTCKNSSTGAQKSDSVEVTLQAPGAPRVITKLITF